MEEIGWVTDDLPADFRLALAHELLNADRPADTVRQTEQVLEQSLVEEERYYAWALLVDAHTAQQDWVAAARLLIAEGYPAKWYDGTLEDPITNGPRCE
jgi:hypothetical protein